MKRPIQAPPTAEQVAARVEQASHVTKLLAALEGVGPEPVRRPSFRASAHVATPIATPAEPETVAKKAAAVVRAVSRKQPHDALRASYLARHEARLAAAEARCGSELERLFLLALLSTSEEFKEPAPADLRASVGAAVVLPSCELFIGQDANIHGGWCGGVTIWQQYPVKLRDRAAMLDFAVIPDERSACQSFAIELDGHEFHERTKEQAAKDRSRDRELRVAGWEVLRFTGSEVWRSPEKCVRDVYVAMAWEAQRRVAGAKTKRVAR